MGYGHSLDLRYRIIDAVRNGSSARGAARRFGVSASSAINLVSRWRKTGSYAPGQVGGQKQRKLSRHEDWLHDVMALEPDITLSELRDRVTARGITISRQSINDMLHALGYRYKKPRTRRNKNAPTWRPSAGIGIPANSG